SDLARLDAARHALRDECPAYAAELVRIPACNQPGERYDDCARLIGERLSAFGYAIQYVRPRDVPDRPPRVNVFGRLEGQRARPTLHFNGHFDVVPAGDPGAWSHPPFDGMIAEGRLWGSGSDVKMAGIAART